MPQPCMCAQPGNVRSRGSPMHLCVTLQRGTPAYLNSREEHSQVSSCMVQQKSLQTSQYGNARHPGSGCCLRLLLSSIEGGGSWLYCPGATLALKA